MDQYKETAVAAGKVGSAWFGVWLGHAIDHITWTAVASVAATLYSVVQTYISIMRYRRGK